jgi:hypothetical protein
LKLREQSREHGDDRSHRFYAAGLSLGATENGAPGIRRRPFYCAFLIDFDGNNIEAGLYLKDDIGA